MREFELKTKYLQNEKFILNVLTSHHHQPSPSSGKIIVVHFSLVLLSSVTTKWSFWFRGIKGKTKTKNKMK